MSIRYKLLLAFGIVLVMAAGVALYGIRAVSASGRLVVELYDGPFMATSHARAAQARFNDARAAMDRALSLRDGAPKATMPALAAAMKDVAQELGVVSERMARSPSADAIKRAQSLVEDWYQTGLKIINPAEPLTQVPMPTAVMSKSEAVSAAIDEVVEDASAYGFQFRSDAEAEVAGSRRSLTVLAGITGVVGLGLAFLIAHSFSRPLRSAMAISERIAASDLSEEIAISRRDEFGRLLLSLTQMQGALRAQADLQRSAADVRERDHASQVARRQQIEQQIGNFREAVGSMLAGATERMSRTARNLSTMAQDADEKAKRAAGAAEKTSSNVASVATGAEELGASVRDIESHLERATAVAAQARTIAESANETIAGLAEAAKRIDDVVGLIRAIAEQTNLLALNATIEAARAGDAGRGFAVVASEVKALATQTAKATEDISSQITAVQNSTGAAVEKIKSIYDVMSQVNTVTIAIADQVRGQGAATEEIARNISDAATGTQYVAQNVAGTTDAIGQTVRATQDMVDAVEYLSSHAKVLDESVEGFLSKVQAA